MRVLWLWRGWAMSRRVPYSWTDDGYAECLSCGETGHVRDSFEMGIGDQWECPCGVTLECVEVELSRRWAWSVMPAPCIRCGHPHQGPNEVCGTCDHG